MKTGVLATLILSLNTVGHHEKELRERKKNCGPDQLRTYLNYGDHGPLIRKNFKPAKKICAIG